MRTPPNATRNYDDPVEWLTPPTYCHPPAKARARGLPPRISALAVTIEVDADPNCLTVTVVATSGGA